MRKEFFSLTVAFILFISFTACSPAYGQSTQTIYSESFESGIGDWFADNGVWEVGEPTTNPPNGAYAGQNCAATVLRGIYPANADTRLISPRIVLPTITSPESIQLRFWHWFSQFQGDPGIVQISNDAGATWTDISIAFDLNSNAWTQYIIDISAYAGTAVRLAFYFTSNGGNQANGWYVDELSILKGEFTFNSPEGFEMGIGNWYAEKGVWEVGEPTTNPPGGARSGQSCAATVLNGIYPADADTRLISPEIELRPAEQVEQIQLRFWHWFSQFEGDPGIVQISDDDGATWTNISNSFEGNSNAWTQYLADITAYAGAKIRLAFYFTSNGGNQANGWYIDDLSIEETIVVDVDDISPEPLGFSLHQNFPNPFSTTTTISYELKETSKVELNVFDVTGKNLKTILNKVQVPGIYNIRLNGEDGYSIPLTSGIYWYSLKVGNQVVTKKMIMD